MHRFAHTQDRLMLLGIGALLALCGAAPGVMAGATDGPAPSARELHTIECIAALEVKADALAQQVKAGKTELQAPLLSTLNEGAAFIGHAYLQGDRDEARSQALRDAAVKSPEELRAAAAPVASVATLPEGASAQSV